MGILNNIHSNAAYSATLAGLPAQIATKAVGKKSAKPFQHGLPFNNIGLECTRKFVGIHGEPVLRTCTSDQSNQVQIVHQDSKN